METHVLCTSNLFKHNILVSFAVPIIHSINFKIVVKNNGFWSYI
jgi:hypothetical protein